MGAGTTTTVRTAAPEGTRDIDIEDEAKATVLMSAVRVVSQAVSVFGTRGSILFLPISGKALAIILCPYW